MSTSVLKTLSGTLNIKIHSPSILYLYTSQVVKVSQVQLKTIIKACDKPIYALMEFPTVIYWNCLKAA